MTMTTTVLWIRKGLAATVVRVLQLLRPLPSGSTVRASLYTPASHADRQRPVAARTA